MVKHHRIVKKSTSSLTPVLAGIFVVLLVVLVVSKILINKFLLPPNDSITGELKFAPTFLSSLFSGAKNPSPTDVRTGRDLSLQDSTGIIQSTRPTPTPTPAPVLKFRHPTGLPLPKGEQTYTIRRGAGSVGPEFKKLIVNNLATKIGDTQKITVTVAYESPLKNVTVTLVTDNKRTDYPLHLTKGDNSGAWQDDEWTGEWKTSDSHESVYQALLVGDAGDKGKASVVVTFR